MYTLNVFAFGGTNFSQPAKKMDPLNTKFYNFEPNSHFVGIKFCVKNVSTYLFSTFV